VNVLSMSLMTLRKLVLTILEVLIVKCLSKLAMTMTPNPNHPILAASTSAAKFQKRIKCETNSTQSSKIPLIFLKMEFMTLACVHDFHQVFDPRYVPRKQEEMDWCAEKQKFAMSVLVHSNLNQCWYYPCSEALQGMQGSRMLEENLRCNYKVKQSSCLCKKTKHSSLLGLIAIGMVM